MYYTSNINDLFFSRLILPNFRSPFPTQRQIYSTKQIEPTLLLKTSFWTTYTTVIDIPIYLFHERVVSLVSNVSGIQLSYKTT